jgi:glycosyltransferase involved in cell wall biosynthesis
MKNRRILMFGPVDFSINDAPKVHFYNLAQEFSKLGFDVCCSVYTPKGEFRALADRKFKIVFSPNPLTGNLFNRLFKYLYLAPLSLWQFIQFKPDIIYFRFSPPAFLYLLNLRLLNFLGLNHKTILGFNSWLPEERIMENEGKIKSKFIGFLQLKSIILVDYVRVVTSGLKDKLVSFGIDRAKIAVVGNGTDIKHFKPINKIKAKKEIGLDSNFLYVGFIGSFSAWKGLDQLFLSIPTVLRENKNIRFLLIGDGPEMPRIKREIRHFKKGEIILTGRVFYEDANKYINAFDIGVAPFVRERNESIGLSSLKIRDYAACGIPVVASRIKGLDIIEENAFGILVEPEKPDLLARTIINLGHNKKLREKFSKNGRKTAEKQFSWTKVAKRILNIVNS